MVDFCELSLFCLPFQRVDYVFNLFPALFDPKNIREENVYKDLSRYWFSGAEKQYLIEEFIQRQQISVLKVCERYQLKRRTVRDWKTKVERGEFFHDEGGRPPGFDAEAFRNIDSVLKKRKAENDAMADSEFHQFCIDEAHATANRQNRIINDPCENTIAMVKHSLQATSVQPQILSNARLVAGSDVRMVYSMWIMATAMTSRLPPEQIWNWDATQFSVSAESDGEKVVIVKVEGDKKPVSKAGDSTFPMGFKWMFMGSASGLTVPFVLLVAVDGMNAEDFEFFEIPGLTPATDPLAFGYICFTRTRAGNANFFSWFITTVAIPTIIAVKAKYEFDGDPFVSSDGEAIVLDEVFAAIVQKLLNTTGIQMGKIPASCSGILQPSDVSPLFRAAKQKLKSQLQKHLGGRNSTIERLIINSINELMKKHQVEFSAEQKLKTSQGAVAIVNAIAEVQRPRIIAKGFLDCGEHPLNLEKMMKQCYTEVSPQILEIMRNATPGDVAFFLQHGHLTEAQMTKSGIPIYDEERSTPRDESVLHHQRAVLITHDATRERRQDYINCGLNLGSAITASNKPKAEKFQLKKDAKLISTLQKREQKKEAEDFRKGNMTEQELEQEKAEKAAKRQQNKIDRERKVKEARERLQDAQMEL